MIDYERAKRNAPKLKAALTRAVKSKSRVRVIEACRQAVREWEHWGYRVDVPRDIYADVKIVADVLAKHTTTGIKLADARTFAVKCALVVLSAMSQAKANMIA